MCMKELRSGSGKRPKGPRQPLDPIYTNGEDELYENKYTTVKELENAFWKGEITMEEMKRNHLWIEKAERMSSKFDAFAKKLENSKKIIEDLGNTPLVKLFNGDKSDKVQEEKREKVKGIIGDMSPPKDGVDILSFFKRKAEEQKKEYKKLLYKDDLVYCVSMTNLDMKNNNHSFNLDKKLMDKFIENINKYKTANHTHLVIETLDGHLILPSYYINTSIINIKK